MRTYQLVASDLDGTLLDRHGAVSKENLAAIQKLAEQGVPFVPVSGRTFDDMPPALKESPFIRYFIYSNGAGILDRQTGERLLTCLDRETVGEVYKILKNYDLHLTVRYGGKTYADAGQQTPQAYARYHVCGPHRQLIEDHATCSVDLMGQLAELDQVEGITMFFSSQQDWVACRGQLAQLAQVAGADSWPYCYEIYNPQAGKGKALLALTQWLKLLPSQTVAVGDGGNDVALLQAAGLSLAVANATPQIKALARQVICSNEEHAIHYIYNHYFERR